MIRLLMKPYLFITILFKTLNGYELYQGNVYIYIYLYYSYFEVIVRSKMKQT